MTPEPWIKFAMKSDDAMTWYVLLHNFEGDNGEFLHGQYLVRVEAGNEFPYKPPKFYFMTPNGVYDVEKEVCISIGQYHPDQYRAALGMSGFVKQLVSGMIGWQSLGPGISIVTTSAERKRQLAAESAEYNAQFNAKIIADIEDAYEVYSAKWSS